MLVGFITNGPDQLKTRIQARRARAVGPRRRARRPRRRLSRTRARLALFRPRPRALALAPARAPQNGQFLTFPEAIRWQFREGGGLPALYGRAAVFRAMYTGHGVLALNFMRHKVEAAIDSGLERFG